MNGTSRSKQFIVRKNDCMREKNATSCITANKGGTKKFELLRSQEVRIVRLSPLE